jgi:hypothetical protein
MGRGRSSRTTPPLSRVPALHASGAGRGTPGPAMHGGHRAAGSGGHRTNVDGGGRSGNDGATGAALHSGGERVDPDSEVVSGEVVVSGVSGEVVPGGCGYSGPGLWRSHRRYAGRAAPPVGEWGWPVILRHLGRGHGRSPDHRPHGGCSAFRGWGETHEPRRDRQLYGVDKQWYQRVAPAPTGTLAGNRDIGWHIRDRTRRGPDPDPEEEGTDLEDTISAETRCSCAARHTLHGAARGRQRLEHSGQRPRGSGAWVASRARHPWVKRGSSLRASDSRDPLSALLTSFSSMLSRSHTACRRISPRTWSTSPPSCRPGRIPDGNVRDTRSLVRTNSTYEVFGRVKTRPVLYCADGPCYDGERSELIGGADKLRRSALHQ